MNHRNHAQEGHFGDPSSLDDDFLVQLDAPCSPATLSRELDLGAALAVAQGEVSIAELEVRKLSDPVRAAIRDAAVASAPRAVSPAPRPFLPVRLVRHIEFAIRRYRASPRRRNYAFIALASGLLWGLTGVLVTLKIDADHAARVASSASSMVASAAELLRASERREQLSREGQPLLLKTDDTIDLPVASGSAAQKGHEKAVRQDAAKSAASALVVGAPVVASDMALTFRDVLGRFPPMPQHSGGTELRVSVSWQKVNETAPPYMSPLAISSFTLENPLVASGAYVLGPVPSSYVTNWAWSPNGASWSIPMSYTSVSNEEVDQWNIARTVAIRRSLQRLSDDLGMIAHQANAPTLMRVSHDVPVIGR